MPLTPGQQQILLLSLKMKLLLHATSWKGDHPSLSLFFREGICTRVKRETLCFYLLRGIKEEKVPGEERRGTGDLGMLLGQSSCLPHCCPVQCSRRLTNIHKKIYTHTDIHMQAATAWNHRLFLWVIPYRTLQDINRTKTACRHAGCCCYLMNQLLSVFYLALRFLHFVLAI